jgi:hypothetical protein
VLPVRAGAARAGAIFTTGGGAALTRAGLAWQRLSGYDGFDLPAGWLAYAGTKAGAMSTPRNS